MVFDFFKPIDTDLLIDIQSFSEQTLGRKTVFNTEYEFPKFEGAKIAIIGVLENRGSGTSNDNVDLVFIRKEFYSLFLKKTHNLKQTDRYTKR